MVIANFRYLTNFRNSNYINSRNSYSSFYIHYFLIYVYFRLSAFYHDSAVALLRGGKILSAVQEERFTRKKHDSSFPKNSIKFCLKNAKISGNEIDKIVFYDKPILKFERLLETYLAFAPRGFKSFKMSIPLWLKEKVFQEDLIKKELYKLNLGFSKKEKILFCEHHLSHAASAFFLLLLKLQLF